VNLRAADSGEGPPKGASAGKLVSPSIRSAFSVTAVSRMNSLAAGNVHHGCDTLNPDLRNDILYVRCLRIDTSIVVNWTMYVRCFGESGMAICITITSVNEMTDLSAAPNTRLAVYGTLAPGRVNHHQISELAGTWQRGTVKGKLFSSGWGAALGFPGLILDPLGPSVAVDLFESTDLPEHWARLDEFEGSGYRRMVATVNTENGDRNAWIYVLAEEP
jgi:gamma-glutamylcyclotransferase (GGCT)/AIG2-like uncharacterized protein YtfP